MSGALYLQPKPSEEEASQVQCPVCKQTAPLNQVGSNNGNKGRWYYACCQFIKFADGMRSRKDQQPLQPRPECNPIHEPPFASQLLAHQAPAGAASQPVVGYYSGGSTPLSATQYQHNWQAHSATPTAQYTLATPCPSRPVDAASQGGPGWPGSQGLSQNSNYTWSGPQPAGVWQHAAAGSPVPPTVTRATVQLSLPKSPPGSLAARAAALSQALQQPVQCVQGSGGQVLVGSVRERESSSDDDDAMLDVLSQPAVQQKVARVRAELQASTPETAAQHVTDVAGATQGSGASSGEDDDEALLAVLHSPQVQLNLQQSAAREGVAAVHAPEACSPNVVATGGAAQAQRFGTVARQLDFSGPAGAGASAPAHTMVKQAAAENCNGGNGAAAGSSAEADDDDVVFVSTQRPQKRSSRSARAVNQVIDLC